MELICRDGHRGCRGTVELTLRNCTAAPVRLLELRVADDGGEGLTTFEPAEGLVAPRASWSHRYQVHRRGDFHVVAKVRGGEGGATTEPAPLRILNPARGEALAACEACDGDWGRHGMLGIEGCNCRTSDAGEPCDDGRDCEGSCLYDHVEIMQTAKPSTCVGGVCRARLATGRPVGTCATHRTTFGCHARIRAGASDQPPSTLPYHVGRICVD